MNFTKFESHSIESCRIIFCLTRIFGLDCTNEIVIMIVTPTSPRSEGTVLGNDWMIWWIKEIYSDTLKAETTRSLIVSNVLTTYISQIGSMHKLTRLTSEHMFPFSPVARFNENIFLLIPIIDVAIFDDQSIHCCIIIERTFIIMKSNFGSTCKVILTWSWPPFTPSTPQAIININNIWVCFISIISWSFYEIVTSLEKFFIKWISRWSSEIICECSKCDCCSNQILAFLAAFLRSLIGVILRRIWNHI